jgi:hypothetical protein
MGARNYPKAKQILKPKSNFGVEVVIEAQGDISWERKKFVLQGITINNYMRVAEFLVVLAIRNVMNESINGFVCAMVHEEISSLGVMVHID